ncbi:ABC transporter permease [Psychrosphaera saromensis]|uniref:Efflux transporter periplasmic adaptor subunit n=1 Tax=Psychrosphaera saromensis TaxID=716813 RepID=A0A2S7UWF1_9GAMM|nr:HlyD family efflux transporter periplasmic adaptor subunit [Psychrosphaera saromensis]PQJ53600.1 efflux transporter periplasmic adaptor subunit [Psychrosphaera saromensis]GHB63951.1 ABC transporter permease [Psychrosphaera saromensis]GLQ15638.1 ABC transporter permease [Psychrosphaera saromensis]
MENLTSSTPNASNTSSKANSGMAMDKVVETKPSRWKMYLTLTAVVIACVTYYSSQSSFDGKAMTVSGSDISIESVSSGVFEDYIPIRSRVVPLKTVYLDAVEGGRVEKILVDDGTLLKIGQPIVVLSNTQLQLDVMRNEAAVTEQLNNMRTIELSLEQNRLNHKRNLIEIEYEVKKLNRQLTREQSALAAGNLTLSALEQTTDLLDYHNQRKQITLESQKTDALMQEHQLKFLTLSGGRLEQSLEFARENIDNLNMKAPVQGKLSGFDLEIGQSISRGERIGQIDEPSAFKLEASIDEFYLGRVTIGQLASTTHNGETYQLSVSKIYPQIVNGTFRVDLKFEQTQPSNIRRGQAMATKFSLGEPVNTLLIPNGSFYQDTGGHWLFVIDKSTNTASRRNIKLGRKNNQFIEVVTGLTAGEQFISSTYQAYTDIEQIKITDNHY